MKTKSRPARLIVTKDTTSDGHAYLTKRMLITKAQAAGKVAASDAMDVMGYVITVEDGEIVKKNSDGSIEKLGPIAHDEEE